MTRVCIASWTQWGHFFLNWTRLFAVGCMVLILGMAVPAIATGLVATAETVISNDALAKVYAGLAPESERPSFRLFNLGMRGYTRLVKDDRIEKPQYLTLIDYTLSSNRRRLWVIDLEEKRIRHHSLVAHGRNSGNEFAVRFSNTPDSHMSSLGFFITGRSYQGKHGISLILDGVEPGINDNARTRAIVIHSADYATRRFAHRHGRLGRSFGCPTLPPEKGKQIIELIKDRSCVFAYFPDQVYLAKTHILPQLSPSQMP